MDPITALGIAGSIVQFVDFGIKVVSKGNKIYHSGDGTTAENHDLETVVTDLILIQTRLRQSLLPLDAAGLLNEDDQALVHLSATSNEVASALLERLKKVKAQGRFRRWKSFRQALKSISSKEDIDELASRLQKLRDQLELRILIGLRHKVDVISAQRSHGYESLNQAAKDVLQSLKTNTDSLADRIESVAEVTATKHQRSDELILRTGESIISSIRELAKLLECSDEQKQSRVAEPTPAVIERAILKSFAFPTIEHRQDTISEAHEKTFQWIFRSPELHDKPWSDFTHWLQFEDDIYWISGKAASGKSTLMKYLRGHPLIAKHLASWSGTTPLIVAHFFFWYAGTPMQKSQAGLLRTLIHQVLDERRELIPHVMLGLWQEAKSHAVNTLERLHESWHAWSVSDLKQLLEDLIRQTEFSTKFCFFIDGLDEYDGDHTEITSLVSRISSYANVKLCLASRPLMVFENEFEGYPTLRLQDLTVDDIRLFVDDKLNQHRKVKEMKEQDPDKMGDLVTEIVQMSSGVFLWVAIVTSDLLKGLTNQDSLCDLQNVLRKLPPELDDLFFHMFTSIKPRLYVEQASRLFQIVYHKESPLSAIELSFADDENPNLALSACIRELSPEEKRARENAISARIKSRCAGLLEVRTMQYSNALFQKRVHYLHLTVKEFLEKPTVWSKILQCTAETAFNPHVSLLRASILSFKCLPEYLPTRVIGAICVSRKDYNLTTSELIEDAMKHALLAEDSTGRAQVALLDELDRTVNQLCGFGQGHWSRRAHSLTYEGCRRQGCTHDSRSFLTFAISRGLMLYVRAKIGYDVKSVNERSCIPLLEYAVTSQPLYDIVVLHPPMIDYLLRAGADPNEQSNGSTPWRRILNYLSANTNSTPGSAWLDICKLFLFYGANPREYLRESPAVGQAVPKITALNIILGVFSHLPSEAVAELEAMFIQRGALTPRNKSDIRKRKGGSDERFSSHTSKKRIISRMSDSNARSNYAPYQEFRTAAPERYHDRNRRQTNSGDSEETYASRWTYEGPPHSWRVSDRNRSVGPHCQTPNGDWRRSDFDYDTRPIHGYQPTGWRGGNHASANQYQRRPRSLLPDNAWERMGWESARQPSGLLPYVDAYPRSLGVGYPAFEYQSISTSYREYQPYPEYAISPDPRFDNRAPRRPDNRSDGDWRFRR